jgi:hypothetical protein
MESHIGWETVKQFYQDTFGIDGWVVEMYVNLDTLMLCASGSSNNSIEKFTELPIEEIIRVIETTFDFKGWDRDLPINPYKIFCSYDGTIGSVPHFMEFTESIVSEFRKYPGIFEDGIQIRLFYLCETMYDIERKIQNEWI